MNFMTLKLRKERIEKEKEVTSLLLKSLIQMQIGSNIKLFLKEVDFLKEKVLKTKRTKALMR